MAFKYSIIQTRILTSVPGTSCHNSPFRSSAKAWPLEIEFSYWSSLFHSGHILDQEYLEFQPTDSLASLTHPDLCLTAEKVIFFLNLHVQTVLTLITTYPNLPNWEFWFLDFSLSCGKTICLAFVHHTKAHQWRCRESLKSSPHFIN